MCLTVSLSGADAEYRHRGTNRRPDRMLSITPQGQRSTTSEESGSWRVCLISPSLAIQEELTPLISRSLPRALLRNIRKYPSSPELVQEWSNEVPDVCFVDVVTDPAGGAGMVRQVLEIDGQIKVVVLLAATEPELILKCLRLGASEFLLQPFSPEQFQAAIPKLTSNGPRQATAKAKGRVYCVMPVKGACGASTVACNLAFQYKRLGFAKALLADLDPLTGTLSFLLKLNSAYTFADVLHRRDTLDADLWKAMVTPVQGVDVLLAPEKLIHDCDDASPILDFARRNYELVVLDAGNVYGEWNLSLARAADEVLLVTTNELPALHGAQRSLAYLDANRVPKWKLRIVINRFDRKVGLSKEAVAEALHIDVVQTIASDYATVQKALIDGKPVSAGSSPGKAFASLADSLAGGGKDAPAKTAPFSGFWSLFTRTQS